MIRKSNGPFPSSLFAEFQPLESPWVLRFFIVTDLAKSSVIWVLRPIPILFSCVILIFVLRPPALRPPAARQPRGRWGFRLGGGADQRFDHPPPRLSRSTTGFDYFCVRQCFLWLCILGGKAPGTWVPSQSQSCFHASSTWPKPLFIILFSTRYLSYNHALHYLN